jgi:hypothetical protein
VHWTTLIVDNLNGFIRYSFLDSNNLELKALMELNYTRIKEIQKAEKEARGKEWHEEKFDEMPYKDRRTVI